MASQTQDTTEHGQQADGAHSTPLSSYIGLAIIAAIMILMIVIQSAGAQGLVE
jgi:hypothetical protein